MTDAMRVRMPVLQLLEMVERLFAVEELDVLRLGRGEPSDRPAQVHEVRLDGRMHRVHADLARQVVRLSRVARTARRYDVGPVVGAAAGEGHEVVACQ